MQLLEWLLAIFLHCYAVPSTLLCTGLKLMEKVERCLQYTQ